MALATVRTEKRNKNAMIKEKKGGSNMTVEEELEHVRIEYPKAWQVLHKPPDDLKLPRFDDNDEMIAEEDNNNEGIH